MAENTNTHPFRIDFKTGGHVRFSNLKTAADSAVFYATVVIDEEHGTVISHDEVLRIWAEGGR